MVFFVVYQWFCAIVICFLFGGLSMVLWCFSFVCLSMVWFCGLSIVQGSDFFGGLSLVLCNSQICFVLWSTNSATVNNGSVQLSDVFSFVAYHCFCADVSRNACLSMVFFCGLSIVQESDGLCCSISTDLCDNQMFYVSWSINSFVQMCSVCLSITGLVLWSIDSARVRWFLWSITGFVQQSDLFCFLVYQ